MTTSTLTKRIEFSASHFYRNPAWDTEKNLKTFGPCYQEHGHNYLLEVTVGGRVDSVTGMIINLYDLKQIVTDVLEEFDHKHLNLDTPYFDHVIPTTENLALVLWRKFRARKETQDLRSIRLFEGEDLWAELTTPMNSDAPTSLEDYSEPSEAQISRRYSLNINSSNDVMHTLGSHLLIDLSVSGTIDSSTGRVTDITVMDKLVNTHLLQRFNGKDVSQDPAFESNPITLSTLAQTLWPLLEPVAGGQLTKITIQNQQDTRVEYTGTPVVVS
ncbi:6-carboxytetrahydropterin synthase [Candidatus Nitronereus thalassa]|uniref:6-carboxy-5,6,7,8-tetrahydropterin synthase n=1 Tax=Candidatus Nitronereus thalassa TaxID=3020898 RepID=A0ABU3K741_9BACT|nr:6-carboxytetrahydropterin synthase [Candidatus Nitronereus thalassa]MDT7042158.1 6-carboxytetrahydropterin synthase [Candidatus Nitronereus thalassa]